MNETGRPPPRFAVLLWTLTALFALRVLGQAIQHWAPLPVLPAFGDFQGSNLPYPMLLGIQLAILALMVGASWRHAAGKLARRPLAARVLHAFAAIYFTASVLRILVGVFHPDAGPWFTAWIPAFFHLVLAGFVWTLALSYAQDATGNRPDTQWWNYAIYPLSVACAFALFAVLREQGMSLPVALYATIVVNALWILLLAYITRYFPYGQRNISSVMLAISEELDQSSRMAGASWFTTLRRITIPLLKPGIFAGWVLLFIIFLRELSISIILYTSGTETLSVGVYYLVNFENESLTAALSIAQTVVLLICVLIFRRVAGREALTA